MADNNEDKSATNGNVVEKIEKTTNDVVDADVNGIVEANTLKKAAELDKNNTNELNNIAETEAQQTKLPYPKSIFFIISNEFCERFNYYGMRTILVLYLSRQLGYSDDTATVIFHVFTMFVYFLCVFGAIISDSWLGKFKTILYLSLVYVCGSIMVTLGAIGPLDMPGITFTMIGLSLIALGSGGIKPCVSAFGGDQFKLPEQLQQMTTFFSLFYFAINAGSLISTSITPILREDVHCFNEKECYSLAFGVPAVLMAVSIVIFVLGRPLYKSKPPAGNMVVLVSKTIGNAISTKWRESKTNPREHWLDYADGKYDRQLIADVKVLMRVLVLFLPLPVFWALFDQQGSRWTFQATRMDGNLGSFELKPDQMQVLNPLLILAFIPLYDWVLYPALSLVGIRRPLQKLTMGGILAGIAFIISAVVELKLEKTYPVLPSSGEGQLRIFNGEGCPYLIDTNIPNHPSFEIDNYGYFEEKYVSIANKEFIVSFTVTPKTPSPSCYDFGSQTFTMESGKAHSLFLSSKNDTTPLIWYEDDVEKPSKSDPLARTLTNVNPGRKITWKRTKNGGTEHEEPAYLHNLTEISTGSYKILVDDVEAYETTLFTGGVYTIIIHEVSPSNYTSHIFEITEANSVSMLWLIPQYVVMTLGEVMFSVTGLEFSYSQAPLSMKSVLSACWLLTVAFGNVIVVIIAELSLFDSQANEFFLFAGLMFADMLLFMFMAYRYQPNNPVPDSETEPLTASEDKQHIPPLDLGIDNKGKEIDN